jgi:ParB-like chromosome segregation protein Spo0J
MEFRLVETEKLRPNPWNPNRMSGELMAKLVAEVRRKGMVLPLVVRPDRGGFQIIDGEHRWQAGKKLGLKSLPCIVAEMDEDEARLKTLQLNRLRGEDDPELLGRLLRELNAQIDLKVLCARLPFDRVELEQSLELMEIKESKESRDKLEQQMQEALRDRILSVVVSEPEKAAIEHAINTCRAGSQESLRPGSALAKICGAFLKGQAGHD